MKAKKVIFLLVFLLSLNTCAFSQNFSVDTVRIYADVYPGATFEHMIQATMSAQKENEILNIDVSLSDWIYNDAEKMVNYFPANTQANSCASWVNVTPKNFILKEKGQKIKILCSFNVPLELNQPEYYATVLLKTAAMQSEEKEGLNIGFQTQLAILIKLTVKDVAVHEGVVRSFDFYENLEEDCFDLKMDVENKGNTLLIIEGNFNIIDKDGNLFGRGVIERSSISPGVTGSVEQKWYGILDSGEYDVISTLEMGKKENIVIEEKHIIIE